MYRAIYRYFPILSFIAIWVLVISLHKMTLFNIKPVANDTYRLIFLGIFSLISGYVLTSVYDVTTKFEKPKVIFEIRNERFFILFLCGLIATQLLGAFIIFYEISYQLGGMHIFFERPLMVRQFVVGIQNGYEEARVYYRIGNYLTNIGFLSTIFGGIYFSTFNKYRVLGLLPIISLLISQLITLGRYKFVSGLIFFIVSYFIFSYFLERVKRNQRFFELIVLSVFSITFIGVLSYYILVFRSPLTIDIDYLLKKSIYLYFTGGVTALDSFLSKDFTLLYGESSFRSVFKWLSILHLWPENSVLTVHNPFTNVTPTYSTNTYTFAKSIYHDFGYVGLIMIPFFWGVLAYKILVFSLKSFSLINIFWCCIFTFSLVISFYSFYFQTLTTLLFWFIFVFLFETYFSKHLFESKKVSS